MQILAENSVDAIVTDPPYELGFMGKGWDSSGIANDVEVWRQALRVLKPGGHLLAFSGTRTYHRMVCAIEDAGFEIRDQIGWLYGSGFPKSLDVSKAIDKAGGDALAFREFARHYAVAVETSGKTHTDIDRFLGIKSSSCYWAREDHRGGMPPRHHWVSVKQLLSLGDSFDRIYDEAEREVIGQKRSGIADGNGPRHTIGAASSVVVDITAPATDAARQWQGWGTALKPAWEPIVVARKPLIGTVAANVLKHGTGAINVDGCRVPTDEDLNGGAYAKQRQDSESPWAATGSLHKATGEAFVQPVGRWPANVIHDGSDEVLAAFPQAPGQQRAVGPEHGAKPGVNVYGDMGARPHTPPRGDSGSAARFFYCAKASKSDRGDGNAHPTVKPSALMRYLCRLVTPPGGLVMDPFTGSGSTGQAAIREGFQFVGFELSPEYAAIAEARLRA